MKKYINYFVYLFKHKWFVMIECFKLGIPWLGITHDWSKFRPSELFPYARHFGGNLKEGRDKTGYYRPYDTGDLDFDLACHLHCNHNKHHWQSWVAPLDGGGGVRAFPIPYKYILEMIADWKGAGKAQGNNCTKEWYEKHRNDLVFHPETRLLVELLIGYKDNKSK